MALIPGLISHIRHYNAAREEFQNDKKRQERIAPLDFGPAFNIDDANLIGETMRGFGVSLPEMPKMPEMPSSGNKMNILDPRSYKPQKPKA